MAGFFSEDTGPDRCKLRAFALVVALAGWLAEAMPAHAAESCLSFAVVPQQSASDLAEAWVPLLATVSRQAGVKLCFTTAPDIAVFAKRVELGEYDFAYLNPYQYIRLHAQPGYNAFAREKGRRLKGLIVTGRDAPLRTLADLANKSLAFPSPSAFAASILPQAELQRRGIPYESRYVASHDSVYLGVARGVFHAGGGLPRTLELLSPDVRNQLRVLWTSEEFPPHAFAAHPRIAGPTLKAVRSALVGLEQSLEGRTTLAALAFKGLEPAIDSDWNVLRALSINPDDYTLKQK
jgi:phosphonate transport system substrate-binding protein